MKNEGIWMDKEKAHIVPLTDAVEKRYTTYKNLYYKNDNMNNVFIKFRHR